MTDSTESDKRTSYLELFFDLVFVFAITQVASVLAHNHSRRGWVDAALLLWLVWWAWTQYTWAGNAIDLEQRLIRLAFLGVTGTALLAAIGIPEAFGTDGAWFAVPYVVVRLAGIALYWSGTGDAPEQRAALRTFVPIALFSPLIVLVGGLAPPNARPWIWAVAIAVDLASVASAGRGGFQIAPTHFVERHGLIAIIALGESIIAVGASASSLEPTPALFGTAVAGFAIIAAMWWAYFDQFQHTTETHLGDEADHRVRSNIARDVFTLGHIPIVGGAVLFAVGVEEAVQHPREELDSFALIAIAAGIALVFLGFVVAQARLHSAVSVERLVAAIVVVGVVATLGDVLSALALLTVLAMLLVASIAIETWRGSAKL